MLSVKFFLPLLILFLAINYMTGCNNSSELEPPSTNEAVTASASATPQVIDVSEFIAEFDASPSAATSKYQGQTVELTGPYVVSIAAKGTNTQPPYIMLAPISGESYAGTFIKCFMSSDEAEKYYAGQQIGMDGTVDGVEPGFAGIINIRDCIGK